MMFCLLLGMVVSVCTCWFHSVMTHVYWFWYTLIPEFFV
jgi:hypothetical protein